MNQALFHSIYASIFISASLFTIFLLRPPNKYRHLSYLLLYGNIDKSRFSLNKSNFYMFYILGILACGFKRSEDGMNTLSVFRLHCQRRLLESIWLCFLPSGVMNFTQFIYGVTYYFTLASYFCTNYVKVTSPSLIFVCLGIYQSCVHCLYMMEKGQSRCSYTCIRAPLHRIKRGSYTSELLFYFTMFVINMDLVSISNLFWVCVFVYTKIIPYT